jgi:hypothetical protein
MQGITKLCIRSHHPSSNLKINNNNIKLKNQRHQYSNNQLSSKSQLRRNRRLTLNNLKFQ